jgi:predicted AAA+ superfamily ATPase
MTVAQAQRLLRGYVAEIARVDVQRVDGVRRDPETVARLLRSLARNVATPASINRLRADVNGTAGSLKSETVSSYLDALSRLMITENLPAWAPSLRSRTRLRASTVRHFVDPSGGPEGDPDGVVGGGTPENGRPQEIDGALMTLASGTPRPSGCV